MEVRGLASVPLALEFSILLEITLIWMNITFWLRHCLPLDESGLLLPLENVILGERSNRISRGVFEVQFLSLKYKSLQHRPLEEGRRPRQLSSLHFCFPHTSFRQFCYL